MAAASTSTGHLHGLCCSGRQPSVIEKLTELIAVGEDVHLRSNSGLTPLMCAARGSNRTPSVEAFNYLFNQTVQPLTIEEKVDGLELLGSTYVLNKDFTKGLRCWLEASELRVTPKVCRPLPDVQHRKSFVKCEWTNTEDIRQLEHYVSNREREIDLLHQAMLVRQRLMSDVQHDEYHADVLFLYCAEYSREQDYASFIKIALFSLDFVQIYGGCFTDKIFTLLKRMIEVLSKMSSPNEMYHHLFNFSNCMAILDWLAVLAAAGNQENSNDYLKFSRRLDRYLDCIVQLAVLTAATERTPEEDHRFKRCLHSMVKLNLRNSDGSNLLLLACSSRSELFKWDKRQDIDYSPLPSASVIQLLLEVGADANTKDIDGNTPLHRLAPVPGALEDESSPVHMLLRYGAHWDLRNREGSHPADSVPILGDEPASKGNGSILRIFSNCINLKCLAAKTARKHIPEAHIRSASLPITLTTFALEH